MDRRDSVYLMSHIISFLQKLENIMSKKKNESAARLISVNLGCLEQRYATTGQDWCCKETTFF